MVQEQHRRGDVAKWREKAHRDEREQREQESLLNQRFTEMIILMVSGNMRLVPKQSV